MGSLTTAGDYHILGRCNDIDGVHVHAARRLTSDRLFALHHFPFASAVAEQEVRMLAERTRGLKDKILVTPEDVVRTKDGLFIVTELVAGETIEHITKNNRALITKLVAVALSRDLARAIDTARDRTGRGIVGDITSSQVVVSYETGDLKVVSIGASLLRGRASANASRAVGLILWEMLTGRKPEGEILAPKAGAELDRIVLSAINGAIADDLVGLAEDLQRYLGTRTTGIDRAAELRKLIRQYYSHKSAAMRALEQRWKSQSLTPRPASIPPRRASSIRPIPLQEARREAALAEQVVILAPEEAQPTDDLNSSAHTFSRPKRKGWPRMRVIFFALLLMMSFATAMLVLINGDAEFLTSAWRSVVGQ